MDLPTSNNISSNIFKCLIKYRADHLRATNGIQQAVAPAHYRADGAVLARPKAAGLSGGRGTDTCMLRGAMAADAGATVDALPPPVMVNPTCSCPLLSPAKTVHEGSTQTTKASLHIFPLPARDQPSDFVTVVCRDETTTPSSRLAHAARPKSSKNQSGPSVRVDACGAARS